MTSEVDDGFWDSLAGMFMRMALIVQNYFSSTSSQITQEIAKQQHVFLEWTLGNTPCPECEGNVGVYDPASDDIPVIPVHPNCECQLNPILE